MHTAQVKDSHFQDPKAGTDCQFHSSQRNTSLCTEGYRYCK